MNINEEYPSKHIKSADLQGKEVAVTISHIEKEDVGGDFKPVLYFQGKQRGMVLNKTNANNIADGAPGAPGLGMETDAWYGKQIILFTAHVDFQGKTVPAIRVRVAPGQVQAMVPLTQDQTQNLGNQATSDGPLDEIPF